MLESTTTYKQEDGTSAAGLREKRPAMIERRPLVAMRRGPSDTAGFSLIEVIFVVLVSMIITACTLPITTSVLYSYRLSAAVSSATWAVQSTRFQALEAGYPFQVTISGAYNPTYQIASETVGSTSFTNIGNAVPISGSPIQLNETTVIQFNPNGTVAMTSGGSAVTSFQLLYQGSSHTITVTSYGDVSVTAP
jgi:Tfp pilus assembly protein FimT